MLIFGGQILDNILNELSIHHKHAIKCKYLARLPDYFLSQVIALAFISKHSLLLSLRSHTL